MSHSATPAPAATSPAPSSTGWVDIRGKLIRWAIGLIVIFFLAIIIIPRLRGTSTTASGNGKKYTCLHFRNSDKQTEVTVPKEGTGIYWKQGCWVDFYSEDSILFVGQLGGKYILYKEKWVGINGAYKIPYDHYWLMPKKAGAEVVIRDLSPEEKPTN